MSGSAKKRWLLLVVGWIFVQLAAASGCLSQSPGLSNVQQAMKAMAADADPAFEVAAIKPSDPGAQGRSLYLSGREFSVHNASLADIIVWAYGLQIKQIANGPPWSDKDKFDIAAVPDAEGKPSIPQVKLMCQKLLADRFKLVFHHEMRELPAYVLSVAKSGPKLSRNESGQPDPGLSQLVTANAAMIVLAQKNASMAEFASTLQRVALDRPVLDKTGLSDRYDFKLTFSPDGTQFGGVHPTASDEPLAPSLFTAVQDLGLRLEALKTAVDVIVIDHVEKPSKN